MEKNDIDLLRQADIDHQIHPQYHVRDHENAVVYQRGEGALLWDIEGKEYIDGLSSLWNVAVDRKSTRLN